MCILSIPLLWQYYFVGAEVEGWGMWKITEGQGPNVWGARGTHSQPVWGKGNIIISLR